jgi:GNAT superfamily N-acetyltransferase
MLGVMDLRARVRTSLRIEIEFFGSSAPGSRVLRMPGVVASCSPATPDRSVFNGVVCSSLDSLAAAYDDLVRVYDDAGVRTFTVWSEPHERELHAFLSERGHVLDAEPTAMAAPLETLTLDAPSDLKASQTRDLDLVSAINDAAFGFAGPAFHAACTGTLIQGWHGYVAYLAGEPVSTLLVSDGPSGELGVSAVATLPHARGRKLASRLLSLALQDARDRGLSSTSLQATRKGKDVYARLGYQDLGPLQMWERRVPVGQRLLP